MPSDTAGYAGLEDEVNFHTWRLLKGIDAGDINAGDPSVTYDPETDLGLQAGDPACFRVSAFNDVIESPLSQTACM